MSQSSSSSSSSSTGANPPSSYSSTSSSSSASTSTPSTTSPSRQPSNPMGLLSTFGLFQGQPLLEQLGKLQQQQLPDSTKELSLQSVGAAVSRLEANQKEILQELRSYQTSLTAVLSSLERVEQQLSAKERVAKPTFFSPTVDTSVAKSTSPLSDGKSQLTSPWSESESLASLSPSSLVGTYEKAETANFAFPAALAELIRKRGSSGVQNHQQQQQVQHNTVDHPMEEQGQSTGSQQEGDDALEALYRVSKRQKTQEPIGRDLAAETLASIASLSVPANLKEEHKDHGESSTSEPPAMGIWIPSITPGTSSPSSPPSLTSTGQTDLAAVLGLSSLGPRRPPQSMEEDKEDVTESSGTSPAASLLNFATASENPNAGNTSSGLYNMTGMFDPSSSGRGAIDLLNQAAGLAEQAESEQVVQETQSVTKKEAKKGKGRSGKSGGNRKGSGKKSRKGKRNSTSGTADKETNFVMCETPAHDLIRTEGLKWMMEMNSDAFRYPRIYYAKGRSLLLEELIEEIRRDKELGERLRDVWERTPTENGAQWLGYFRKHFLYRYLRNPDQDNLFDEGIRYPIIKRDYNLSHMSSNKLVFGSWYGLDPGELRSKPVEETKKILKYCFFKLPLVIMHGSGSGDRQSERHHIHPLFLLASRMHGIFSDFLRENGVPRLLAWEHDVQAVGEDDEEDVGQPKANQTKRPRKVAVVLPTPRNTDSSSCGKKSQNASSVEGDEENEEEEEEEEEEKEQGAESSRLGFPAAEQEDGDEETTDAVASEEVASTLAAAVLGSIKTTK